MKPLRTLLVAAALGAPLLATGPAEPVQAGAALGHARVDEVDYQADVEFALDELKKRCGHFFKTKDIDWKKVEKEFQKAAKSVTNDTELLVLMVRLLARLEDGHAELQPGPKGADVKPPADWQVERRAPGLVVCQSGKKYYVKAAWGEARELGLEPGMEVVKIGGEKAKSWIEERQAELCDRQSFSTDHQAFFYTTHWGFAQPDGTRLEVELKTLDKKKRKRTLTCTERNYWDGPAVPVQGLKGDGDSIYYGRTAAGYGYLHVRRVKGDILAELDAALAALHDVPGMILDFRGNSGGGCDHDAVEARFVPKGSKLERMARAALPSQGEAPYGGPLVVIVDATVRSSGETLSGMFKEDGRGYMIGDSPTAGMSSQKDTIELPSGLFALYVSVGSNRSSFNGGQGIEGIGVPPQELVEYDPEELAAGVDTMLRRAEELLADFPQKEVRYDPADHGWER